MASDTNKFMEALKTGDVAGLRDYLDQNPKDLQTKLAWNDGGSDGFALNYAAYCNQPRAIEFLVTAHHADVNSNQGIGSGWTPLHHAEKTKAYDAATALLALGADPSRKNDKGETTAAFCNSEPVRERRDPQYTEKKKRLEQEAKDRKIAGTWTRTGPREVVHDHELPGSRYRLTDIFNFDTRCWRAITKDLDGGGVAQNILFFDDMPDTEVLRPALAQLKDFGGNVDENEIGGERALRKSQVLRPAR